MDTNAIRERLKAQGWSVRELPIRKCNPDVKQQTIGRWKLIAIKGEKTLDVEGPTLDEAMKNLGATLGVIARTK